MTFEERLYLVKKRRWPKAQEAAGYLDFNGRGGRVVSNWGRKAGTMECICDELGKEDGRLCRLSVDRYCRRKRSEKVEPWLTRLMDSQG